MKKSICLFPILLSLVVAACTPPQVRGAINPKFYGSSPIIGIASDNALADAIGTELISYNFRVIERTKLHIVVDEQTLSQSGLLEDQKLIRAGRILNIHALIFVRAAYEPLHPGKVASAVIRIVDVQSGEVLVQ